LSEEDVEWTLGRLCELGVAREVHPRLSTGGDTVALMSKLARLVKEMGLERDIVPWRLRLAAMTRRMSHDELYLWLEQLKLKRSDSAVVRAAVVMGPALRTSLSRPDMSDWEVYKTLRAAPEEAIVFALADTPGGLAGERLRRYLTELRTRILSVGGDDILALGVKRGPGVGRILERLRELRVQEIVRGRERELEAARDLVKRST
jgi:tRNA nucleotidyltransferase (CCA-adding enzyme)